MENKTYTITLKSEDIKTDTTCTGMLIDKMALASGQRESDQLFSEGGYDEVEDANIDYVFDHFDWETACIEHLNELDNREVNAMLAELMPDRNEKPFKDYKKQNLLFGAFLALNYPDKFAEQLKFYTDYTKEETLNEGHGSNAELAEEIQDARDNMWKQAYKEWLHGDYHGNYKGVLYHIRKYFGAEEVNYNEKTDTMSMSFDSDLATDICEKLDNKKASSTKLKHLIIESCEDGQIAEQDKRNAECEKSKAEHERIKKYQAGLKAEAEAERVAKLSKMIKK